MVVTICTICTIYAFNNLFMPKTLQPSKYKGYRTYMYIKTPYHLYVITIYTTIYFC